MSLKKKDLFRLQAGIIAVGNFQGVKFAYAINKNKRKIDREIMLIQESIKLSERMEEFNKKRKELCEKYAEKDVNGKAVIVGNEYKILVRDNFNIKLDLLEEEYKEDIEARKKDEEEFNKMVDEDDTDIDLHMIDIDLIPENITVAQMGQIQEIIKE